MAIRWEKDEQNIVTLTIDMEGRSTNVMNDTSLVEFREAWRKLAEDSSIVGAILTSGKKDFIVGADLDHVYRTTTAQDAMAIAENFKAVMRQWEKWGKPVVAALNGSALGGGLEAALACHYRVALNSPKAKFGFPEVNLGLLPGGGGTQRVPRLIGIQKSLPILMEGKDYSPTEALKLGLIHTLANDTQDLIAQAKAWILANPQAKQPWDQEKFRWPGGDPRSAEMGQMWSVAPAMLNQKTHGNYLAPRNILACVYEGALVDFDTGSRIESRYFANCVISQISKNMITAFWYQNQAINKGDRRPAGIEKRPIQKLGILGAGMMGSGIAYVSALAGMQVVLKDVALAQAEKGKAYSQGLLEKRVAQGKLSVAEKEALLARILPTDQAHDLAGCDLVIEAVFEDRELKAQVTREAEAFLGASSFFASNTSTLPISGLAQASARPEKFIGLHFFSPVDKMQLVEIIVGQQTDQETLARAFDYVQQIRKTPIVVNDSRGFYTSRVFMTYVLEGLALLEEGQNPRGIESAGLQAGMPVGPLALSDEISLSLMWHILEQTRRDLQTEGKKWDLPPGREVVAKMVNQWQRIGKKAGQGFYDYPADGKKSLWSELPMHFSPAQTKLSQEEMMARLLFVQAIEAVRCLEENVVTTAADANLGSIYGWGFAPFHGGVLQYINAYGLPRFVEDSRRFSERFGARFNPPKLLLEMAAQGKRFE